ncbi:transposon Tf2-6 polyprotein [Elysia marginata]|uniref:Transposon Tf2-6 polyprotein n=1 Tax=Elysia marginata TaxID=1093978 RepID=A0AAV4H888_9GAST|nr:transposon Tf2-6 polyprotein [Elysia marginata]
MSHPKEVSLLTPEELLDFMVERFHSKRFIVRKRYKFWSSMGRRPGETIQELVARNRQDAVTCDFAIITNPQDEAIRIRLMCPIDNEAVVKPLSDRGRGKIS